ncbi:MAG TPA: PAS domain S-box protein [Anaerolineales bacterium]|nr:PAS domain S-box protein [Anaerolineales bacterium]
MKTKSRTTTKTSKVSIPSNKRERAKDALRQSEERFAKAFRSSPVAIIISRVADGKFIDVNDAACQIYGYTREELLGHTSLEMKIIKAEERRKIVDALRSQGVLRNLEVTVYSRSAGARVVLYSMELLDMHGEQCMLTAMIDITERKQVETELMQMKRLYATLSQVNQTIVRVENQQELFDSICKVAVEFGELRLVWIGLFDPETGQVTPMAEHGEGENKLPFQSINAKEEPYRNDLIGLSLESGLVQFSEDVQVDARMAHWRAAAIKGDYHSAAAVPIRQNGKIIGLLNLYATDIGFFTVKEEQRLLEEMGLDISFALDNMDSESRRRQAEDEKFRLMQVLESSLNEIYIFDDTLLHFHYVNQGALKNLGYSMDELRLMTPVDLKPEFTEKSFRDMIRPLSLQEKDILVFETVHRRKNGMTYPVEVHLQSVKTGDSRNFVAIIHDITERKQAEQTLRESEERLRLSLHAANQGLYDLNVQTGDAIVNREYAEMLGYDPETFVETNAAWIERLHPDDREVTAKAYSDYTNGLLPEYRVEFRQRMKDGNWKWILSIGKVIEYDAEGKPLRMLGTHTDITKRKQAEEKLRESEHKFSIMFDKAPFAASLSKLSNGAFVHVNEAFEKMFGYTREEATGKTSLELGIHPDPERLAQTVAELKTQGHAHDIEQKLLTRSGAERIFLLNIDVIDISGEKYALQTAQDFAERKRAEERIKTQLERLASLRAIDAAITSSTNLNMTFYVLLTQAMTRLKIDAAAVLVLNPVTNELEVYARQGFYAPDLQRVHVRIGENIAGQCAFKRAPLEDHFLTKENFSSIDPSLMEEGFTCYLAIPLINKAKTLGVLEIFERGHRPHDQDWVDFLNALAGQAAIAIDNFQLFDGLQRANTMLERRVAERTRDLYQANAELEHANRAKDEFLATMSHELRTPLNSILGLSESLLEQRRGSLNEHQQKSLQIIETSGHHLLDLINDILDLSKIDAGKFDIYPQVVEVNTLCQSSLTFIRQQATRKSISLAYEEDKTISKFQADPRRVKQILVNLLTNAVKFTPEGGRVTLQVRANVEQDLVQFSVSDNGIGIAPEDLRRLFQPFVQVDSNLNRQFEGTGLGLALVQKLTDLHGGSVHVESEVHMGSRFTVNLPWQRDMAEPQGTANSKVEPMVAAAEGKPKLSSGETSNHKVILLAEDNMANILTIGEYLESHGYSVAFAHDGWEAISKAEEVNPDIILMDIQMPSLDGLEATRRLRANPRFATTPIIAITALAMPGDRERCLEAGANEYMSKPVKLQILAKIIETMLEPGKDISQ